MESNGLPGGMFSATSGMGSTALALEMSQNSQNTQTPQNPHPQSVKHTLPFAPKPKPQQFLPLSDEDEPGNAPDDGAAKQKMSPWQRMKWTDNMVRLLIMAVYYIGDEAGSGSDGLDPSTAAVGAGKKKPGGGLLQKKGKWKSVSRAMMEKGFYVSPQQCEDKFNDLNKRYKRVNDILGKGTACKVVENQKLLDTMDHLSPKMKEEARKLLNSKHLFFREMCAYHTSCSAGGAGTSGGTTAAHHSPPDTSQQLQPQGQQHQHRCLHSPEDISGGNGGPNLWRAETEGSKVGVKGGSEGEEDDSLDEDDEDGEDDEEVVEGGTRLGMRGGGHDGDDEEDENGHLRKRSTRQLGQSSSPLRQEQLRVELGNVVHDGTRSVWEKRQWMKMRVMQLEEERVGYQYEAFELEKQRLKWVKYSGKKEREMEQMRLKNERMKLENERAVLLLRQKELELVDHHQTSSNRQRSSEL